VGEFNVCSLFSGGGGLDLGIHRAIHGARTVVYVEVEAYACACLAARMAEGTLAPALIWTDVCTFDGKPWRGVVDLVAGGSPCQDLSVAGKRAGLDGSRSGLFFEFIRIVGEIRPEWVFWENVGGATKSLPRIFAAFEELGYVGAAVKVRASDVGAPHQRARIFLLGRLADSQRDDGRTDESRWQPKGRVVAGGTGAELADTELHAVRVESGRSSDGESASRPAGAWGEVADGDGRGLASVGEAHDDDDGRDAPWDDDDGRGAELWLENDIRLGLDGDEIAERLADAERGRREVALQHRDGGGQEDRGGQADRPGVRGGLGDPEELADPSGSGPQERVGDVVALREEAAGPEGEASERSHRPEWPPGPDGDWSNISTRFFPAQSNLCGVDDGVARKLEHSVWADRLRLLGNGVVPAQASEAFRFLYEATFKQHP